MTKKSSKKSKLELEWGKIVIPPVITVMGAIITALLGCMGTIVAALLAMNWQGNSQVPSSAPTLEATTRPVSIASPTETLLGETPTAIQDSPLFVEIWEGDPFVNQSSYSCLYAWPKSENHPNKDSKLYYQKNTWSVHPLQENYEAPTLGRSVADIKPASPAYVILSSRAVLIKEVILHVVRFEPAPNINDFVLDDLGDACGTGGGTPPQLLFERLTVGPFDSVLYPVVSPNEEIENYSVTSLPYQMNENESLSFEIYLNFSVSGTYVLQYSILATDFQGKDYEVDLPEIIVRRLYANEEELIPLSRIQP